MQVIRRAVKNFEEIMVGTLVVVMSLTALTNVVFRYFFNSPFSWAEEFAGDCFIWLVFFGAALCTKQRRHLVIDAFVVAMPNRWRWVCNLFVDVCVLGLMAALLYYGTILTIATTQRTATLGIPKYYIYSVFPITTILALGYTLRDLIRDLKRAIGGEGV